MKHFNIPLSEVLSRIDTDAACELLGVDCGKEVKFLLWDYTVNSDTNTITGESFYGSTKVTVKLSDIKFLLGVSVDIDVDEYGGASYCDLKTELTFRHIENTNLFNQRRPRK